MRSTLTRALFTVAVLIALVGAPAQAKAAGPDFKGVQLHSLWGDSSVSDIDRELDLADDAGANVVRVDVAWSSLESGGKGQISAWYGDKLDHLMNGAHARGIKVIAGLWSTPCWASSAPESKKQGCAGSWWDRDVIQHPPSNNQDFADISRWVTSRYGSKLAALEVWNEPNLEEDRFWIAPDEPAAYASMLKAAYPAAKAGNSQVPVLAGSLAVGSDSFVNAIYAHGIKGSYDGMSVHPYSEGSENATWGSLDWMRDLMRANGDTKPLWLTEFGFSSCSVGGWCSSETKQAQNLAGAFERLEREPNIKAAVVYNLREKGTSGSLEDNFGLVNRDFSRKPAFNALKQVLTALPAPIPTPTPAPTPRPTPRPTPAPTPKPGPVPLPVKAPAIKASAAKKPAPTKPRPRPAMRVKAKRASLKLRLVRRGRSIVAMGHAPRRALLTLRLGGCPARTLHLRARRNGRFSRRLGSVKRLRRCRVTLKVLGVRRTAAKASMA